MAEAHQAFAAILVLGRGNEFGAVIADAVNLARASRSRPGWPRRGVDPTGCTRPAAALAKRLARLEATMRTVAVEQFCS